MSTTLRELFVEHRGSKGQPGFEHFLDVYEERFDRRRGRVQRVLEIGVQAGGSLRAWADYFPNAEVHGIDRDPRCRQHADERIRVHVGHQEDGDFLDREVVPHGPFDLVIDDGGHHMHEQWASLERLWPSVASGGAYVIEDLHTSYLESFGGTVDGGNSTVARLKGLFDGLQRAPLEAYVRSKRGTARRENLRLELEGLAGLHVYGGIVVLDKSPRFHGEGT